MEAHLLITEGKVHEAIIVAIEMNVLGSIDGQHEVVDAQTIPLSISIGVDAGVQQLVIGGENACTSTPISII